MYFRESSEPHFPYAAEVPLGCHQGVDWVNSFMHANTLEIYCTFTNK